MGAGKSNMRFAGDSVKRQNAGRRPLPENASPMAQERAPGLEATPPGADISQGRLPRMEQFMQSKGSPEYEQVMERIRGMNALKNTGSKF
jgi:hypothetical protein